MDDVAFANWLGMVGGLNSAQRARALETLAKAEAGEPSERPNGEIKFGPASGEVSVSPVTAVAVSSTWDLLAKVGQDRIANFGCPHCGADRVQRWGGASGKPRYRCTGCRKTFNPLTATPLAGLHRPDRWQDQAAALISGESLACAAKRCDVHPSTAFRWRHRFLAALNL